jgi:anhydro-N-acetylmuramic acid kinase
MISSYYIGVMSGNSLDNIDVVLVSFENDKVTVIDHISNSIDPDMKERVRSVDADTTIAEGIIIDSYFASAIATTVLALTERNSSIYNKIVAIGSHGQTIYHVPNSARPISIQLGNPNIIAARTGIDVIADFRRRDIAEGGQGAPLAPIFHEYLYASKSTDRFIVNIGGIANVTHLSPKHGLVAGFDVGPGNILLDENIKLALGKDFDNLGCWAKSGCLLDSELNAMLEDPYLLAPYPKSTGREYFNRAWLNKYFDKMTSLVDVQATLTHLTACAIANAVKDLAPAGELVLAGGGANNAFLTVLITKYANNYNVISSDSLGLNSQLVEATTFAYLAKMHCDKRRLNLFNITGAKRAYRLGVLYPA